ncbi:bromodomain containing protein, partial [Aphelenchoides avenae]
MPLLGKEEFKRLPPPHGLKPDSHVYYLKQSGEVFVDYNSYFERLMQLNSMVWTCSATRRTGLTFEEALESERTASPSKKFPQPLELAIMYFVQRFSKRYGIDDLVNDIYEVLRERYFINEPVFFGGKFKRVARVIG